MPGARTIAVAAATLALLTAASAGGAAGEPATVPATMPASSAALTTRATTPPAVQAAAPAAVPPDEAAYVPINPVRVHDMRSGVTAGTPTCVQMTGAATGIPAGADGVALNVASVQPAGPGHVVVYPDVDGTGQTAAPVAATVNFQPGADISNAALVDLPPNGRVCYFVRGARAGIVIDAVGYLRAGSGITLRTPARLHDVSSVTSRQVHTVQVTGVPAAGVPAGATAVIVNVAVAGSTSAGHLRLFAAGTPVPPTASLNYPVAGDRSTAAIVQLSPGGALSYWSDTAPGNRVRVVLDVVGWTVDGSAFVPVTPTRLLDTRATSSLIAGQRQDVTLPPGGPVPGDAGAVVLSVVGVVPTGVGNLAVAPYRRAWSGPPPIATLNYVPGGDIANLVVAAVGDGGRVSLYNDQFRGSSAHVVVDVVGYLTDVAALPPVVYPTGTTVVGTGTPASCTSAALAAAVRDGGYVAFSCGPAPVTIVVDQTLVTCNTDTCRHPWQGGTPVSQLTVDGGGLVTLSGGGARGIFYANACQESFGWLSSACQNDSRPSVTFRNITFADGNAQGPPPGLADVGGGGAIAMRAGTLTLEDVVFRDNRTVAAHSDWGGGAVRVFGQNNPATIIGSTFTGNRGANGGALSSLHAPMVITDSVFTANTATGSGASNGNGGNGGAVYFDGTWQNVLVQDTTITGNVAPEGGPGIFYVSNSRTGTLTIDHATITGNTGQSFYTHPYRSLFYLGTSSLPVIRGSVIE
ncbi:right-handed parallel beta-helix repeat-containing protein [Actinotalea fermentans]|uniref:Right handed beta helix domain-containing protein n=1 Tax=Actinotalea fermentans TaxID=43671 RepID=A0A511YVZ9_9CELL|nr:right-handed parallel beta-helix repeat-containing protein [Actinotalea fermentans]KGM15998.1 hypothetical protein N867_03880 [Actinotalea fermentans ATCC 43279 = JCM 9966 = DSM 3133]GEN79370.1 hypothetical protein AFE02nite_11040 [Actinotalea fermentans]